MQAEIFWVAGVPTGRLAVLPRPRGGDWLEDEVASLHRAGVDVLVSLLTSEETAELDLTDEANRCAADRVQFISFPITDRSVPACGRETITLVQELTTLMAEGKGVAIHCRQGIGRAGLLAACVLTSLGDSPGVAFDRIARARGCPVPDTPEQREWVGRLSRDGWQPL